MDFEIIITIVGAVGGITGIIEFIKFYIHRKSNARIVRAEADKAEAESNNEEWKIWNEQIERMNTQIEYKDARIAKLNQQIEAKEDRFIEQTQRLRECQDREYKAQLEINRLNGILIEKEQKISQLELLLKDVKCHRLTCLDREPKNDHTRQAEAEAQSGAPTVQLKQTKHRKTTKHEDTENSD